MTTGERVAAVAKGVGAHACSLGSLWGLGWLGHVLNAHWPIVGFFHSPWWVFPFAVTALVAVVVFFQSISYLTAQLRKV